MIVQAGKPTDIFSLGSVLQRRARFPDVVLEPSTTCFLDATTRFT